MPPLSSRTPISLSIAGWVSIVGTVGYFGWQANNYVRDIRDETKALATEIGDINSNRWDIADQQRYNYQLERLNRDKLPGFQVPEVRERTGR